MTGNDRTPSRTSSFNTYTHITAPTDEALLGAASAFGRPIPDKSANSAILTVENGAQEAAMTVGYSDHEVGELRNLPNGPAITNRSKQSDGLKKLDMDSNTNNPCRLESPAPMLRQQSKSPSLQAASVAAARAPPAAMVGTGNGSAKKRATATWRPAAPPKPKELSNYSSKSEDEGNDDFTNATNRPPTTSLVELFERKTNSSSQSPRKVPEPVVIRSSSELPIKSPKPIRSSGGITTMFQMELDGEKARTSTPKQSVPTRHSASQEQSSKRQPSNSEPSVWDPNTRSFRPQSEVERFQRRVSQAEREDARRSPGTSIGSVSETGASVAGSSPSRRGSNPAPPLYNQNKAINIPLPRPRPTPSSIHSNSDPIKTQNTSLRQTSMVNDRLSPSPVQSAQSLTAQYNQLYQRRLTPSMTGDQLANAMVASSLASSRNPSPHRPNKVEPPPPPTRRHKQHKLSFSRTPSPAKIGMLHTLRKTETDNSQSEDEMHPYSKHKKEKHRLVRKHPNKHHEGDRKRWRDAVTERERKRYEGVWAANKGMHCSFTIEEQLLVQRKPSSQQALDIQNVVQNQISNIVAQELWSRSRLPEATLENVWDLVDNDCVGRLGKDEFVVGMWLIDQLLKGRKPPVKVSESVWASVRGLQGIKLRKSVK